METYAVYLWPRGSLASEVESDTLFGAVCWAIRTLGLADVGTLLEEFDAHPRFAFSSTFPVYRQGNESAALVRFYPRPLLPTLTPEQVAKLAEEKQGQQSLKAAKVWVVEKTKRLKEKHYLSEALFAEVVQGRIGTEELFRRFVARGHRSQHIEAVGNALITYDERSRQRRGVLEKFVDSHPVQHNQVDRIAGATAEGLLFFEQETFFRPGGGLWCVLRAEPDDVEQLIRPAFRYLEDTGLGANRTSGKGHFDIEIAESLQLPQAEKPNAFVTLSRYLPRPEEWSPDGEPLAYRLLNLWPKREHKFARPAPGQRTPPVRKRRIRMFAPGSVFPLTEHRSLYGCLAKVVSAEEGSHPVWQSGLAIPVFARFEVGKGGA